MKRYYAHDFLIGDPILIDRKESTIFFYHANVWGQIYNLEDMQEKHIFKVDGRTKSGLIRRVNGRNYDPLTARTIDKYIYTYLMDEQEQERAKGVYCHGMGEPIAKGDSLADVLLAMCQWVYKEKDGTKMNGEEETDKYFKQVKSYLKTIKPEGA